MSLTQSQCTHKISDIYLKFLFAVSVLFCPISFSSHNEKEFMFLKQFVAELTQDIKKKTLSTSAFFFSLFTLHLTFQYPLHNITTTIK